MKLLTDQKMRNNIASITASSTKLGTETANLLDYDPGKIWEALTFDSNGAYLVINFSELSSVDYIWLNNANFLNAIIQANNTDSWGSPSFSKSITLKDDEKGIYKGFFKLTETQYNYIRIVIPDQTLLFKNTVPWLGNVIIGEVDELTIDSWDARIIEEFESFRSSGGSYEKFEKAKPRHSFNIGIKGRKVDIDAAPLKHWAQAVIFTDLEDVADSYLVYPPTGKRTKVENPKKCEFSATMEERV